MENLNLEIEGIFDFCKILNITNIRTELLELVKDYKINNIERRSDKWVCTLVDANNSHITLYITPEMIEVIARSGFSINNIVIEKEQIIKKLVDIRENGIIYSIVEESFVPSKSMKNENILVDLNEKRFVFSKDKIDYLFNINSLDISKLVIFPFKFKLLQRRIDLRSKCDFYTEFETHMNYYSNCYVANTYFNEIDISNIFNMRGIDCLYRIFDLYNGVENERNQDDINNIRDGKGNAISFDFKGAKGVKQVEDILVGKSRESVNISKKEDIIKLNLNKSSI